MKKSTILAATVATLMAGSVAADTTVYGKVRLWLAMDDGAAGNKFIGNNSSRVGWKGSEDLGNGMSAVYQIETAVSDTQKAAMGQRLIYGGIKGDFGQVAIGSQWTPSYALVRGKSDPFASVGAGGYAGNFFSGTRTDNAISYINKFGDVKVAAAIVAAEGTDTLTDATDIAVSAPIGPITLGVAMQSTDAVTAKGDSWTAVDIGYKSGPIEAHLAIMGTDVLADDWTIITAHYNTGSGKISAQIEDFGANTQTNVGYTHKLSKKTSLFVEMSTGDIAASEETNVGIHINF